MALRGRRRPSCPARPALFPSFFLGGFECSSHVGRTGQRQDLLALTQHDRRFVEDYALCRSAGLLAVREGVHWHLCGRGGRHGFGSAEAALKVVPYDAVPWSVDSDPDASFRNRLEVAIHNRAHMWWEAR